MGQQTPMEIARSWYNVDEIERSIHHCSQSGVCPIPHDIKSRAFAVWLTEQYQLAMAKGIQMGREHRAEAPCCATCNGTGQRAERDKRTEAAERWAMKNRYVQTLTTERDEAREAARHFYQDCISQEFTDGDKAMLRDHPWLEDTNE